MPKRATTKPTTQRAAPYQLRSVSNVSQAGNMAIVASPVWHQMQHHTQHTQYPLEWSQPPQFEPYPQDMMLAHANSMGPHISRAPAVQQVQPHTVRVSSHSHSNSGGGSWTPEMDDILIRNHKLLKWDQIAEKYFGNTKTGNACRKRHARVMLERKEPSKWDQARVDKVIDAYNREGMRERIWKPLAEATNEDWEHVERLCYGQGFRVLTSRNAYGHSRRRSRAVSHRSHASTNSDGGVRPYDDEDGPTDDSGIGVDYQTNQPQLSLPQPEFHPPTDSYADDIPGYAEDYYRYPQGRN